MPMHVTFNLPRFQPLVDHALLKDIGDYVVRVIRTRTQQGVDRTGKAFAAYTPGYAAKKAKELGSGAVNLTVSGRMLNDMGVTDMGMSPPRVTIGFRSSGGSARGRGLTLIQRSRAVGAEGKARAHDVDGVGKARTTREFLGLTDAEETTLRERVQKHLEQTLQRQR